MSNQVETSGRMTNEELLDRINDCRIRILEELGIEVPANLRKGADHESVHAAHV